MTNEEILNKAIEKAEKNGFIESEMRHFELLGHPRPYEYVIYNHDFAKAFWGEARVENLPPIRNEVGIVIARPRGIVSHKGWQYHLQQMVLEEDPIKYLERFL